MTKPAVKSRLKLFAIVAVGVIVLLVIAVSIAPSNDERAQSANDAVMGEARQNSEKSTANLIKADIELWKAKNGRYPGNIDDIVQRSDEKGILANFVYSTPGDGSEFVLRYDSVDGSTKEIRNDGWDD